MFYGSITVFDQSGISSHTHFSGNNGGNSGDGLRPSNRSPDIPLSTC